MNQLEKNGYPNTVMTDQNGKILGFYLSVEDGILSNPSDWKKTGRKNNGTIAISSQYSIGIMSRLNISKLKIGDYL